MAVLQNKEKKRGPGRPMKGADKRLIVTYSLSPDAIKLVEAVAKKRGVNKSFAVEFLVQAGAAYLAFGRAGTLAAMP